MRWCKAQYLIVSYNSDTCSQGRKERDTCREGSVVTDPRRIKLFLRDVTEIFEKLLPTFTEEPRFVSTAPVELCDKQRDRVQRNSVVPMILDLVKVGSFPIPPHGVSEVAQKLNDLLRRGQSRSAQRRA